MNQPSRHMELILAAREEGRQQGEREGFVAGTRWGIFCGALAGICASGVVSFLVVSLLKRAALL